MAAKDWTAHAAHRHALSPARQPPEERAHARWRGRPQAASTRATCAVLCFQLQAPAAEYVWRHIVSTKWRRASREALLLDRGVAHRAKAASHDPVAKASAMRMANCDIWNWARYWRDRQQAALAIPPPDIATCSRRRRPIAEADCGLPPRVGRAWHLGSREVLLLDPGATRPDSGRHPGHVKRPPRRAAPPCVDRAWRRGSREVLRLARCAIAQAAAAVEVEVLLSARGSAMPTCEVALPAMRHRAPPSAEGLHGCPNEVPH